MSHWRSSKPWICVAMVLCASALDAVEWSTAAEVVLRETTVVSFRARVVGGQLIIEAHHQPGWHTYALDNVERARARTGQEDPETELPLRMDVSGALRTVGPWYQSEPVDLSQPDIRWYTWGFSGDAVFATPVAEADARTGVVLINGQACTDEICARIDDLVLELPRASMAFEGVPGVDVGRLSRVDVGD